MSLSLSALRTANLARQAEWDKAAGIDVVYRANELAGEVGEACNVIKKLSRERLGIRGARATVEDLASELADVVICVDLVAMSLDLDFRGATLGEGPFKVVLGSAAAPPLTSAGLQLTRGCGLVSSWVIWGASSVQIGAALDGLLQDCALVAAIEDIDLGAAVVAKFNATSEKVGLATRMIGGEA
ncbi:MAG TPA: MazG-like family protein [Caulobacteraceae bacterium]|jgi:NTP pyrophosphatase (non-canonical NTP hydrolase)|nr:MazG-like family protein [Caulobacteraceae bacterium]